MIGGKEEGISEKDLYNLLKETLAYANGNNNLPNENLEEEVKEIMKYLNSKKDDIIVEGNNKISLKDFINILTN